MGINKRQSIHQMELTEREVLEYKKNMGFERGFNKS
jgi:hypothetical protein